MRPRRLGIESATSRSSAASPAAYAGSAAAGSPSAPRASRCAVRRRRAAPCRPRGGAGTARGPARRAAPGPPSGRGRSTGRRARTRRRRPRPCAAGRRRGRAPRRRRRRTPPRPAATRRSALRRRRRRRRRPLAPRGRVYGLAPDGRTWQIGTWTFTESAQIDTPDTRIFVRHGGAGPPLLLLHGFPQTHLMWRDLAPRLARDFSVVCADLRGYGRSGCPPSDADHAPYAKRALAARHGRGDGGAGPRAVRGRRARPRRARRLPRRAGPPGPRTRLAVLDVLPVDEVWDRADARLAVGFWPWSLLAQAAPLPERLVGADPAAVVDSALGGAGGRRPRRSRPTCATPTSRRSPIRRTCTRSARSTGRPPSWTRSTTAPTARPAAASPARCSRCGAGPGPSARGTRTPAARSRCGASWPPTCAASPWRAGTSSPRSTPRHGRGAAPLLRRGLTAPCPAPSA